MPTMCLFKSLSGPSVESDTCKLGETAFQHFECHVMYNVFMAQRFEVLTETKLGRHKKINDLCFE